MHHAVDTSVSVSSPTFDLTEPSERRITSGVTSDGERAAIGPRTLASLLRRANHDALTGLANRSWLINEIEQARTDGGSTRQGALFLIDLDGFKAVNDTWGHAAGDAVLVAIGERLTRLARGRSIAARLGGDEFALWMPDSSLVQAQLCAERIVAAMSEPIPGDLLLTVGASVGWVLCSIDTAPNAMLSRADTALYAVKERGGRAHQSFTPELAAERVEGRILQREIRQALRSDQFRVAFQAIMTMGKEPIGCEALARWQHPRRGLLRPASFLPAVKSAGSTADFDEHMAALIVSRAMAKDRVCAGLPVWLNLTEESLRTSHVERLLETVEHSGLQPADIVVEISEQSSVESTTASAAIEAFAAAGMGIAIDDFGAGYSRLGLMKRLPIQYVKIDRSFVDGVARDASARALLEAMIGLVRAIGAETVAEGVESEEDLDVLAGLGCELVQGYVVHMPELSDS